MPRYHFNLRDGAAGVTDPEGTILGDEPSARAHALDVARELMHQAETKRRHWYLEVCDQRGQRLFDVPFSLADRTIDHLGPETRRRVERLCIATRQLAETIFEARTTVLKSRALRARLNGKPYLAAECGRRI